MKTRFLALGLAGALLFGGMAFGIAGYDPAPPASPWGPADEAGNTNLLTPQKATQAKAAIVSGESFVLAHLSDNGMPVSPSNTFVKTFKTSTHVNKQIANQEAITGDIAQAGTQFDALCHFGYAEGQHGLHEATYYNGFSHLEVVGADGLQKCGVDKMRHYFTRAILVDVSRFLFADQTMPDGAPITLQMAMDTLAAQGMTADDILPGDVVLFRTGWERNWSYTPGSIESTLAYYKGFPGVPGAAPGLTLELAIWLAEKQVSGVGADNWGVDVQPAVDAPAGVTLPVHNHLLTRGIPLFESLKLEALASHIATMGNDDEDPYVFAFSFAPMRVAGAAGSPASPIAIL